LERALEGCGLTRGRSMQSLFRTRLPLFLAVFIDILTFGLM
jgi:hypothetical protein